jgi:hypothetical protein
MIQAVCRPGRLTDGPYTSYDLNTLLKATAGERRAVVIGKGYFFCSHAYHEPFVLIRSLLLLTLPHILLGDKLVGEVSRLVVAEACIQALDIESTEGQIYEINSVKVLIFSRMGTISYWQLANYHQGSIKIKIHNPFLFSRTRKQWRSHVKAIVGHGPSFLQK